MEANFNIQNGHEHVMKTLPKSSSSFVRLKRAKIFVFFKCHAVVRGKFSRIFAWRLENMWTLFLSALLPQKTTQTVNNEEKQTSFSIWQISDIFGVQKSFKRISFTPTMFQVMIDLEICLFWAVLKLSTFMRHAALQSLDLISFLCLREGTQNESRRVRKVIRGIEIAWSARAANSLSALKTCTLELTRGASYVRSGFERC